MNSYQSLIPRSRAKAKHTVDTKVMVDKSYHFWYNLNMDDDNLILQVRFYRTASGNEPVHEWLADLALVDRKTVGKAIKTVQFSWPLGMPLVRKLEPGLWEVRSLIEDGIVRVLFTVTGNIMVLLHGFVKKSQKTPQRELETARRRLVEVRQTGDYEE